MHSQHGAGENFAIASEKSRARVLVVDDEALIRWSVGSALASAGYDVLEAADGAAARRHAADSAALDFAVLDLRLPDTDGVTLLEEIRRLHPECRFLIMTAFRTPVLASRPALATVPIMDKPFGIPELVHAVDDAICLRS
jgi:DNA-binding NtrC family response regulator